MHGRGRMKIHWLATPLHGIVLCCQTPCYSSISLQKLLLVFWKPKVSPSNIPLPCKGEMVTGCDGKEGHDFLTLSHLPRYNVPGIQVPDHCIRHKITSPNPMCFSSPDNPTFPHRPPELLLGIFYKLYK